VFQTDAVMRAITARTKIIFLNTPNNPTGQLIPIADLKRIARAAPHAIVLIDEAYIEFGGETFLPELTHFPNVLVGRTFSKAYGLAGMRVGIVIGQAPALDAVRAVTLPFNVNAVAMAATCAALEDTEFLPRYAAQVAESRRRLYEACRAFGLEFWESAANYVMVRVGGCAAVRERARCAQGPRARSLEGSLHARLHPDHGRHDRAHRCRDRGARIGRCGKADAMSRSTTFDRRTTETQISGTLAIDGRGRYDVRTGIRFFDHMLELFTPPWRLRSDAARDRRSRRRPASHRRGRRHRPG
jgi:hypothetical protein